MQTRCWLFFTLYSETVLVGTKLYCLVLCLKWTLPTTVVIMTTISFLKRTKKRKPLQFFVCVNSVAQCIWYLYQSPTHVARSRPTRRITHTHEHSSTQMVCYQRLYRIFMHAPFNRSSTSFTHTGTLPAQQTVQMGKLPIHVDILHISVDTSMSSTHKNAQ